MYVFTVSHLKVDQSPNSGAANLTCFSEAKWQVWDQNTSISQKITVPHFWELLQQVQVEQLKPKLVLIYICVTINRSQNQ